MTTSSQPSAGDVDGTTSSQHGYTPSPYPLSILPKVHLSKPRPKLVQIVDVPPTPVPVTFCKDDGHGDGVANDDKVNEEREPLIANAAETYIKSASDNNQHNANTNPLIQVISTDFYNDTHTTNNATVTEMISDQCTIISAAATSMVICTTCNKHQARYTCPKCQTPYCSVACYRIHESSSSSSNNIICTESFYKDRVLGTMNGDAAIKGGENDDTIQLRNVLTRIHRDINNNLDSVEKREASLSQMLNNDNNGDATNEESDVVKGMQSHVQGGMLAANDQLSAAMVKLDARDGDQTNGVEIISDEDLAELAQHVLQMGGEEQEEDDNDEHDEKKGVLESIPPHLLAAFESALASATEVSESHTYSTKQSSSSCEQGELEKAWAPFVEHDTSWPGENQAMTHEMDEMMQCSSLWWVPGCEGGEVQHDINQQSSVLTSQFTPNPTLDERILALPSLLPTSTKSTPNMTLAFNIIEVLYATSFVMRVRRNMKNASRENDNHDVTIDETALLLSQSMVLSCDARYSSVREAMMACAEHLVDNKKVLPMSILKLALPTGDTIEGQQGQVLSWDTLSMDAATLSSKRRYVLRMLFEALDVCRSGLDRIKIQLKGMKSRPSGNGSVGKGSNVKGNGMSKKECEESKRQYKLASKKIEYMLSWTSSMWSSELESELSNELRAFVTDWQLDIQQEESSVEKMIRGIHANDNVGSGSDGGQLGIGGIFDIGGSRNVTSLMEEDMVSVSTVRKRPP